MIELKLSPIKIGPGEHELGPCTLRNSVVLHRPLIVGGVTGDLSDNFTPQRRCYMSYDGYLAGLTMVLGRPRIVEAKVFGAPIPP